MIESLNLSRALRRLPARASRREAQVRAEALAMIEREALAAPAFSYRIVPVRGLRGDSIDVGEAVINAPVLASEPGELTAVAAAACALGPAIQARASELFSRRRPSLALALDTIGNELLFRVADRALAAIRRDAHRDGLGIGVEASPGDPGVPLDQQTKVLALAGTTPDGMEATPDGSLRPVHALTFLVAVGRNLPRHSASARCNRCPSANRCEIRAN